MKASKLMWSNICHHLERATIYFQDFTSLPHGQFPTKARFQLLQKKNWLCLPECPSPSWTKIRGPGTSRIRWLKSMSSIQVQTVNSSLESEPHIIEDNPYVDKSVVYWKTAPVRQIPMNISQAVYRKFSNHLQSTENQNQVVHNEQGKSYLYGSSVIQGIFLSIHAMPEGVNPHTAGR